jgi:hypothetical protein
MKMTNKLLLASLFLLVVLNAAQAEEAFRGFSEQTKPFLKKYCLECHAANVAEGGVILDDLEGVDKNNAALWIRIWEQTALKQMPPTESSQPEALERHHFNQSITTTLEEVLTPHGGFDAHFRADKANHLDHDLLFGPLPQNLNPPSSPARIWRIHPNEHLSRLNDLINRPRTAGFRTIYDDIHLWNEVHHVKIRERHGKHIQGIDGDHKVYFDLDRIVGFASSTIKHSALKGFNSPLIIKDGHGLKDYAHYYTVNEIELNELRMVAQEIIRYMAYGTITEDKMYVDSRAESNRVIKSLDAADKARVHETVAGFFYKKELTQPLTPIYDLMREDGLNDESLVRAIRFLFEALTLRSATDQDIQMYLKIVKQGIEDLGKEQGVISGLSTIFVDQLALFRTELVDYGTPDEFGRVMLQGEELLLAINSAFSFIAPDDTLRQSLKDGKLKTREDVEREVTRLLNDDQFQKPKILQFFREYFDYDHAFDVLKDVKSLIEAGETVDQEQQLVFKQAMVTTVHNTDRLIELVLSEDEQVLRELLTTRRAYISARDWKYWSVIDDEARRNEEHWSGQFKYGVPKNKLNTEGIPVFRYSVVPPNSNFLNHLNIESEAADKLRDDMLVEGQLVTMPPWLRKGILTHPSWLVSHSNAMDNHVIHRGIWIRERLLGSGIPDVPITVDAMLPDEPGETLRHRMRVTKENQCWRCHKRIDPLGFAFEAFTHAGRMRRDENGQDLDQSGEIIDSGVPGLDGPVAGFDLIDKLADHPRSEQVFVRYAFRYWMGRNETLDDAPVIQAAYQAYRDNNGSMKALLVSLLTSDAFLYRKRR